MNNTIIFLYGFPGTGKLTIAKEICEQADVKLVDNHLINNPVVSLFYDGQPLAYSDEMWKRITKIRAIVFDTIRTLCSADESFVMTGVWMGGCPDDQAWYESVISLATDRNARFVPICLICAAEERQHRIVNPDRAARCKTTNPDIPARNDKNDRLFTTEHSNLLNLDVTDLAPEEAARIILEHAKKINTK